MRGVSDGGRVGWVQSARRMIAIFKEVVGECGGLPVYNPRTRL